MRQEARRDSAGDERERFRDTARAAICGGLILALVLIGILTHRAAGGAPIGATTAYVEGGFRALLAIGIAFAAYVGTRAGE